MPPNTVEIDFGSEPKDKQGPFKPKYVPTEDKEYYGLKIFQNSISLLAHILIGIIVGVSLLFGFANGLPLRATPLHIILCVVGYQLLMAEAILSLNPEGGFSSKLSLVQRRRAHWILQIGGSCLAIIGSFVKISDVNSHFNTLHGKFAFVALVFTSVSLVNGLASLYSYELRKFLPGNLSKLTHIIFGVVAFTSACISLCYGFDKNSYTNWATTPLKNASISFVAILVFIININPLITFFTKSKSLIKK